MNKSIVLGCSMSCGILIVGIMLSVVILSNVMLSVIVLRVGMLNVLYAVQRISLLC